MRYKDIKDFSQRCEEHPDHQSGMISHGMIQQRLHEEIDELRDYIEQAEKQEPDLPPVEIGVDVTEHGTTVVAFYRRPNAVMEMFYSQFHPQPKQPKNPSIRIQNHSHTDHPTRS